MKNEENLQVFDKSRYEKGKYGTVSKGSLGQVGVWILSMTRSPFRAGVAHLVVGISITFEIIVRGMKHQLIANNWKDLRVYLYWKKPNRYSKREELGFLSVEGVEEDELELRGVPDEIADFIEENRERILEEAEY